MVMANVFGAGFSYDSFLLGFRIPNLTRDLFAEGAMSSAFVPTFTGSLVKGDQRQANKLANLVTTAILIIVGSLCALGMLFAPQLVMLLAPGFATVPSKFELAVRLTRIMFPFLLLIALSAQATGMLNSSGSFGIPAVASIFFNIGSIGLGLMLGYIASPRTGLAPIEGMAYGVVFGGALQLGWQIPKLHSLGFRFRPAFDLSHPGLRRIVRLMLPAIVANIAVQINAMINTSFASRLDDPVRGLDGPVSWLGYALRFVQLPLGLFAVAFASALLPSVSRSAAANDFGEFRHTLSRALGLIFLLTIPSSIGLILLGRPIVGAVYQGGHFQVYDTHQTALALACYSLGLVAYASSRILHPAFFALSDARTPMYMSLFSVLLNLALPLLMLNVLHLNFSALALTTAFAMTVESVCLFACLRRKLGGLDGRYLLDRFLRITAAALLAALPVSLVSHQFSEFLPTRLAYCGQLAVCVPMGIVLFVFLARFLGVKEIDSASGFFIAPLRRARLPRLLGVHARIRS
jgi:putative peptidoglycan lipid II flippase